jgi:hypothetical protein
MSSFVTLLVQCSLKASRHCKVFVTFKPFATVFICLQCDQSRLKDNKADLDVFAKHLCAKFVGLGPRVVVAP